MRDVEWYLEHYDQPEFLFSPDADFPLICGEKGGYSATITSDRVSDRIVEFDGGTVGNAVAGEAYAIVRADASDLESTNRIDVADEGDGRVRLTAHGIGAHASTPEGSINAIGLLVDYLLEHDLCGEGERDFLVLERHVFGSTDGSTLGTIGGGSAEYVCIERAVECMGKPGCEVIELEVKSVGMTCGGTIRVLMETI